MATATITPDQNTIVAKFSSPRRPRASSKASPTRSSGALVGTDRRISHHERRADLRPGGTWFNAGVQPTGQRSTLRANTWKSILLSSICLARRLPVHLD